MRVEETLPDPILGVSTLAPRSRRYGSAALQENLRSDPVNKLTRRPPSEWEAVYLTGANNTVRHHSYRRDGSVFRIFVEEDGSVTAFVDGVSKTVTGNLTSYMTSPADLEFTTIKDTTFVVDKETIVAMDTATDESDGVVEKVGHINFPKALNYQETINVTITHPDTLVTTTITYTAPNSGTTNQDAHRATEYVAKQIAAGVNADPMTITALSLGSSVAIWHDVDDVWLEIDIESGQGEENVKPVNHIVVTPDNLPYYAVHGTVIKIQASPNDDRDSYYLRATGTDPDAAIANAPANRIMQECVWEETRNPDQAYGFDETTLPHTIVYNAGTDDFTVGTPSIGWDERGSGDDVSNPVPDFVGRKINATWNFQRRLVFLADDQVFMSETNNLFGWWKQTALKTLVTDPIAVASSAAGIDKLERLANHNKDLMILSANGQFKIPGSVAVTPETVAMPLTTTVEIQTTVNPVEIGNTVFMPISYGASTGLFAYTGERNTTQDQAQPVTAHVVGYMPGTITHLTASSNLEMMFLKTSGQAVNEIFVYEQQKETNGVITQMAWSTWVLPTTGEILDMEMEQDVLTLIVLEGTNVVLKKIQIYAEVTSSINQVYLDDLITLSSSDGVTATIPADYDTTDCIIVKGENTDYPLENIGYTVNATTITLNEDVSGGNPCTLYIGKRFTSRYRPTRPFTRDRDGNIDTNERVRVQRWVMHIADTYNVKRDIISNYANYSTQEFVSFVLLDLSSTLGTLTLSTRRIDFSYGQEASQAEVEFWTDSWLGWTVTSLAWEGQVHKRARKL